VSRKRTDWEARGAFLVGKACQAGGRYADAVEAYRRVIDHKRFADHLPTLHNLAVCEIRCTHYDDAVKTLDHLLDVIDKHWKHDKKAGERRCSASYNRALALQYRGDHADAVCETEWVLGQLLAKPKAKPDRGEARLEEPALMMHAGLLLTLAPPGTDVVERAARAVAARSEAIPSRSDLATAVAGGRERPEQIEAYVRAEAADDSRVYYNLLCFVAGLARRHPAERKALHKLAFEDAGHAFHERKLVAWAKEDPTLEDLRRDPAWPKLLAHYEPTAAKPAAKPAA
jgi:tetratricopeptide (TPR) repeat protein